MYVNALRGICGAIFQPFPMSLNWVSGVMSMTLKNSQNREFDVVNADAKDAKLDDPDADVDGDADIENADVKNKDIEDVDMKDVELDDVNAELGNIDADVDENADVEDVDVKDANCLLFIVRQHSQVIA